MLWWFFKWQYVSSAASETFYNVFQLLIWKEILGELSQLATTPQSNPPNSSKFYFIKANEISVEKKGS
jgi:hypothetical protein